jgi:hypothetical protein
MASKTGKRGAAIVVLMIAAAIAASPGTASAGVQAPASTVSAPAAPAAVPVLGISLGLDASWAEASWAES